MGVVNIVAALGVLAFLALAFKKRGESSDYTALASVYSALAAGTATRAQVAAAILLARRNGWESDLKMLEGEYNRRWGGDPTGTRPLTRSELEAAATLEIEEAS